ncbi:MAG: hypothetical protein F2612_01520 [Actinobacteria bacterium]|jgi:hypothetical protein|nr:hypothetical protein [Ilumatobacteraceae bacterium]MSZ18327.1 hypothetical protein [Actinomycetota bacterium]
MCTRRLTTWATVVALTLGLTACGGASRTGTSFCRQLAQELPAIAQRMQTSKEVNAMVDRYERLLERSPLTIEKDMAVITDLLQQAAKLNTNNPEEVQALADATYAANQSALQVRDWVKSTCAVDISSGLNIEPPRVATTTIPTTTAPATTVPAAPVPVATTVAP